MTHYCISRSSISVMSDSFHAQDNFDISRLSFLSRSPTAQLLADRSTTVTQRLIGIYPRGGDATSSHSRLTITSKGSDELKSTSITLNHVRRSVLSGIHVSARQFISVRFIYTRVLPVTTPKGGGPPFHLFHLPDSRADGSDRIRKRHLIRRRGHFTFCPPVCPSVRPSMCRISFPSFSLFAPPTDRPIAPRQDTATAYRSCNACRDRSTTGESTRFFFFISISRARSPRFN